MKLTSEEIKAKAVAIVKEEVDKYNEPLFFVTEKVAFSMRDLIRKLRKNYWGIFETDKKDKQTNKDNIWVPLTRLVVDTVRKNVDFDSRDTNIYARNKKAIPTAKVIRNYIKDWQARTFFGEVLNDTILDLCIDGTAVWKTLPRRKGNKLVIDRRKVELLNCYIDPNADSIQSAFRFTERSLMTADEIAGMDWMDNKDIKTQGNLHPAEKDLTNSTTNGEYADVYELWGKIPESLITGTIYKTKADPMVDGRIVVSGIETGDLRVHVIERNTNKDAEGNIIKPYEEARYIKVANRWYGVSPAEMVLQLQEWVNRVVNLRIKKNTNASLGLFKIRNGAGITQQQLNNLVTSGVIKLNNMDDIENMVIAEAGQGSYEDERIAKEWAFEVTNTLDSARGAPSPASASATATVIEDRNVKTAYTIIKESIGLFLDRWMTRHFMPHLPQLIKQEPMIKLFADFEEIETMRQRVVSQIAMEEMDKQYEATGYVPSMEELQASIERAMQKLRADGDMFIEAISDIVAKDYDAKVVFTNEEMDVALTVQNLMAIVQMVPPQAQSQLIAQAVDLLGLDVPEELLAYQPPQQALPEGQPTEIPSMTEQQLTTSANVTV